VTEALVPVFVSVDPKRDTVAQVRAYVKGACPPLRARTQWRGPSCRALSPLAEFSPKLKGLTGTPEQVARAARAYRVYFSISPGGSADGGDYLVDHSIFFYLLDPAGQFVDYYGQNKSADECMASIASHISAYRPAVAAATAS
jgi:protein SCO1